MLHYNPDAKKTVFIFERSYFLTRNWINVVKGVSRGMIISPSSRSYLTAAHVSHGRSGVLAGVVNSFATTASTSRSLLTRKHASPFVAENGS